MPQNDERPGWTKRLKNLQEENIRLKIMLSKMILHGVKPSLLTQMEAFQNRFLGIDSAISGIKQKIAVQQVITNQEALYHNKTVLLANKREKLQLEIEQTEKDFATLAHDFNVFVEEGVPGIS